MKKKILIQSLYANLIAASDQRSRSSLRKLPVVATSMWISFLAVSSKPRIFLDGKSRTALPVVATLLLKKIATSLKSQRFPPSFASFLGPWCGSLHTHISAIHCGWSAPGMPPSDWWRTPCKCWCLYLVGELSVSCVHIVVYTAHRFFM